MKNFLNKLFKVMVLIISIPGLFAQSLFTRSKDKNWAANFVDGEKITLDKLYIMNIMASLRRPFTTTNLSFEQYIRRARRRTFEFVLPETYKVRIINDPYLNCSWMWVKYLGVISIDFAEYFGLKYCEGHLYKLPFISKQQIKDFLENDVDIDCVENKLREIDNDGHGVLIKEYNANKEKKTA